MADYSESPPKKKRTSGSRRVEESTISTGGEEEQELPRRPRRSTQSRLCRAKELRDSKNSQDESCLGKSSEEHVAERVGDAEAQPETELVAEKVEDVDEQPGTEDADEARRAPDAPEPGTATKESPISAGAQSPPPAESQPRHQGAADQIRQLQSIEGARQTSQKTVEAVFAGCERDEDGGIKIGDIYLPPPPPPACTFDATGPRLIISKIENSFFKSYGKNVIIGPLHKNYSAIVGPNGSGKSNVIDSMLFVFGYRSKKVRAQKVSNLIHNCDVHKTIQRCSVDVHFETIVDRGEAFEVVPNSHLVIGRVANRDNSSYYTINGLQVTQKVVTRTLREKGIDIDHDRFLILQGEVEQISMMKPKGENENDEGMLEYLEDIVGTNRYKEPIEKFVKNVDELQEERNRALDRVQMAEQDMQGTKQLRDEALEYLNICNDLVRCDQKLYAIKALNEAEKKAGIQARFDEENTELEKVKQKMNDFIKENEELTAKHKALVREEADAVKKYEDLQAQYRELEKQDVKCIEESKHGKSTIAKLEKDREAQVKKIEKLQAETEKLPEEKAQAERDEEELTQRVALLKADLHSRMEDLNKKVSPIQTQKETLEKKLLELQRSVNSAKSAFTMAQVELDVMTSSERNEKEKLETSKSKLSEAENNLIEKERQAANVEEALPKFKQEFERLHTDLANVDKDYEHYRSKLNTDIMKLEEMRAANSAARSNNRLLDALMAEKQRSLKGVVGRLGDLGGIDKKYDVAISMSCGHLDAIVVDTTATGKACIKFLQKNQLGKANFLALEKMQHLIGQARQRINTPENVPRLIDLVQVSDPEHLGVFYYALRDTLVANEIDQATRVGLHGQQRFRVVTLRGEIVDPNGTLTGGGNRVVSGKMGTKAKLDTTIDQGEIDALGSAVRDMDQKLIELGNKKSDLERSLSQKKKDLEQMQQQQQKVSFEVQNLKLSITSLKDGIKMQQGLIKEKTVDSAKLAQQQKKVDETKDAYEDAVKSTEEDRRAVEKLDEKINKIKEENIGDVKAQLEAAQEKLRKTSTKKTECQVGMNNAQRKIDQAQQKLKNIEEDLINIRERRKQNKKMYDELTAKGTAVRDEMESMAETKQNLSSKVAESARSLHEFNKQENKLKIREVEQQNIVKDLTKELEQCVKIVEHFQQKMNGLRLEVVDDGDDENAETALDEAALKLPELDPETVKDLEVNEITQEKADLEERKKSIRPNLNCIQEYKKKMGHYRKLSEVYLGKQQTLDTHKGYLQALKKARLQEFMTGFKIITQKVKEMYRTLTLGGDADLELVDSLDPFAEGIAYSVRPPRKTWKNISNLSGGEKTLSSLSLVFALHYYKPAPFYVMDEIDAALDHKNVSIIANYINERTKNTQFIIISLRDEMFSLARKLTGIYKPYNDTRTLTLDIDKFVADGNKENAPANVEG